jgi:phosphatidylethanolamine/phosphatidyl-N-methylethanolamine N-methyltransferase
MRTLSAKQKCAILWTEITVVFSKEKNLMLSFYKALFKNPRAIGAIIPSSGFLAQAVAKSVLLKEDQIVIEIGAGTGVITKGLLDAGIAPERIIPIESSDVLAQSLKQRFPQLNVIHGDAFQLEALIKPLNKPVGAVICGLPLLLFSPEEVSKILNQVAGLVSPGGYYIKYTYGFKDVWSKVLHQYRKVRNRYILLNIPPARVSVYEAPKT